MLSWIVVRRNSTLSCPHEALFEFKELMEWEMWQLNGIMLLNAIVMGAVVFIGVFASRYRRHPIIGLIFIGANTLFLPVVSLAAGQQLTDTGSATVYYLSGEKVIAQCRARFHDVLALVWTGLVVFVVIHISAVVVADPREGRNIEPSIELLTQAIWVAYLMGNGWFLFVRRSSFTLMPQVTSVFIILVACSLSKILQKYQVFYVARGSFILGRNPRLIVSYMDQIDGSQDTEQVEGHVAPPSLIVMEGGPITLEEEPRGYSYKYGIEHQRSGRKMIKTKKGSELVTLDRVFRWLDDSHFSKSSTAKAKDLCFSFALFKLLRCRFAKYTVSEAGFTKASKFFWHMYLLKGADYRRVFKVIADELSLFHDYYYSPMPIPFFHRQFLLSRVVNQVLGIGCCLYIPVFIIETWPFFGKSSVQLYYKVTCVGRKGSMAYVAFGRYILDVVPVCFVVAMILISEIRETVSYLCSNFTKVVLICSYVSRTRCPKSVVFVFKYLRCEWLLNNWDDKMSQCKLLLFHRWEVSILWRRLFRLPNQKRIKVPSEVKESIFEALQGLAWELEGQEDLKHIRLPRSPIPGSAAVDARSECDGKGAADTILAWHITTSIFEVRQPQPADDPLRFKTAAVVLSQYCAYLVSDRPELLPDHVDWCKTLHRDVKKEAARVLAKHAATPGEDQFQHMVDSLIAESKHEVLSHGARLAQQLVESGKGWKELAQFWSEMILYIAPSEKLDEHAEAISRGGELVTLVWALLAHAGIVERVDDADATAATSDAQAPV